MADAKRRVDARRGPRSVVLRDDRTPRDLRHLEATIDARGGLTIAGQDLGRGVRASFGASEYEWRWRIGPAAVPAAMAALGGGPGDDPLEVLAAWSRRHGTDPGLAIKEAGVPAKFSSRIGD